MTRALPVLLLLLASIPAAAEDEGSPRDAEALAAARAAFTRLEASERFSFRVRRVHDVVQESGQHYQFGSRGEVLVRRPDRLSLVLHRDDGRERRVLYDGAEVVMLDVGENAFARFAVPPTLDATLDFLELEVGAPMPLADLLYADLGSLLDRALEASVVGPARVGEDDVECQHLAFRGEHLDWQLWIDGQKLIRKVVITYTELPGSPQVAAVFDAWNLEARAPDARFEFVPPEGAEQIPALARPPGGFAAGEE